MASYMSNYLRPGLFWHKGGSDLFETRFTAQRIPKRIEADLAIGYACREFRESFQLLDGFVALFGARTDRRIKIEDFRAVERVFCGGKKLSSLAPFAQRFFFPAKRSID